MGLDETKRKNIRGMVEGRKKILLWKRKRILNEQNPWLKKPYGGSEKCRTKSAKFRIQN